MKYHLGLNVICMQYKNSKILCVLMNQFTHFVCTFHFFKFVKYLNQPPVCSQCMLRILPCCESSVILYRNVNSRLLFDTIYMKSVYPQLVGHLLPLGQEERDCIDVLIGDHSVQLLVCHTVFHCHKRETNTTINHCMLL